MKKSSIRRIMILVLSIILTLVSLPDVMGNEVKAASSLAVVTVDCNTVENTFVRLEQYNNLNPRGAVDAQISDFQSYNTKIARYFGLINQWFKDENDINSLDMDWYDEWFNQIDQAELYSDSILMPIKGAPACLSDANWDAANFEQVLITGLTYLKQKYSKLEYVSCWNEPNHPDGSMPNSTTKDINTYMELYGIFENAVNAVNSTVTSGNPLKLGGPITASYKGTDWVRPFIEDCNVNNRKLDFVGWNHYSTNADVGGNVTQTQGWLDTNGFTNADIIITEYGIVGGGSNFNPTSQEVARQMAMMASAGFEYMNAGAIPMHWINEHSSNYIKSQYGYNFKYSSSTTYNFEEYDFDDKTARYVRIQGYGNDIDNFTSIKEVEILDNNNNSIPIQSVFAGGDFDNINHLYDGNNASIWESDSTWRRQITFDLGSNKNVSKIRIAWNNGDVKQYKFAVQTSTDEVSYSNVWDTSKIFPYGHLLKMQSMLATTRVETLSTGVTTGAQGVNAIGTIDTNKVAVLLWNYQNTGTNNFDVTLDINNLPSTFTGKDIRYEQYYAAEMASNYQYMGVSQLNNPVDMVISSANSIKFTLNPNVVSIVVLTPVDPVATPVISQAFNPTEDAYVQGNGTSDGTGTTFAVKKSSAVSYDRKAYIKFDLGSKFYSSTDIKSATLKVYVNSVNGLYGITAYEVLDDSWNEGGITWNNAPVMGNIIGSMGVPEAGKYYKLDVTDYVKAEVDGNDIISFAFDDPGYTGVYGTFNTSEAVSNKPILEIEEESAMDTIINPTNDSYVRDGSYADTNYGNSTDLVVKSGAATNYNRNSYLKFDVSGQGLSQITSAKLRVYCTNAGGTTIDAYRSLNSSNNWVEGNITWNNQIGLGTYITSTTVNTANQYYEWDVTSLAQEMLSAGIDMTIILHDGNSSKNYFVFNSKEAPSNKPELIIRGN